MRAIIAIDLDQALSDQIRAQVRDTLQAQLHYGETKAEIAEQIGRAVRHHTGHLIRGLVLQEIRRQVQAELEGKLKGLAVDQAIRDIVTDLFRQRFGGPQE